MLDHSCQVNRAPRKEHRGDFYDTPPVAVHALLKVERLPHRIWEPAAGKGNIVAVLRAAGHEVVATDLNDRGCPDSIDRIDFLLPTATVCDCIVTNPPFALAQQFVEIALERAPMVVMLLRLAFYESERRAHLFGELARIHVFGKRLPMMHREDWAGRKANSGMCFAWFVWQRGHTGPTTIDRIEWEPVDEYRRHGIDPSNPNPDGSDFHIMNAIDRSPLFAFERCSTVTGCDRWPDCGCGTQFGPHTCEERRP